MKNSYCELSNKQILALPERFRGFLLSPFQFNLRNGMVTVPEDTFQDMIDVIAEYAALAQRAAPHAQGSVKDAVFWYDPATSIERRPLMDEAEMLVITGASVKWGFYTTPMLAASAALSTTGPMLEEQPADSAGELTPEERAWINGDNDGVPLVYDASQEPK
jgi:hypothetical protein